ncbi:MAG: urea carboxylase [Aquisalimonadaceae bacterium]
MLDTLLIANRGEIAVRIIRTLKAMGIRSVAIHSDADRNSPHVAEADIAVGLGGNSAADSYLQADRIIAAAVEHGAGGIIPGYGFLAENADFAAACEKAGILFVGPTPEQIRSFGLKHTSRELAAAASVPVTPGTSLLTTVDQALAAAEEIGYPVMLKSTAGGGGIGLTRCEDPPSLAGAFDQVQRLGQNFFSDAGVFLERYIDNARHVEVQIFGDGNGEVIALGERDCSLQRRNQKVVEETPAPGLPAATRTRMLEAAVSLGRSVNYRSAGTVEFIYDGERDDFYFLEVNARLQVEHPITELVTGVDLVEWMVSTAAGSPPDLASTDIRLDGAAIEVRLYAEDPVRNFQPCPGVLTEVRFPGHARVDSWVASGSEVSPYYDPMLAKLIVHGRDRDDALARMEEALAATRLSGIATNLDYLRQIIASPLFRQGKVSTAALANFDYAPPVIEVLEPGTYTTVQDYPGRLGYWNIGVPPSGPMDDYAFRVANRVVGNHESAAGVESTILGPRLRFHCATVIALTGAPTNAMLDGEPVPFWQPVTVEGGQTLTVDKALSGCRTYLAIRGGLDVPEYLGSRSTFALGQFGGHAGRPLKAGDMLPVRQPDLTGGTAPAPVTSPRAAAAELIPDYDDHWDIGVLYGPHGAPDFFTEESIESFFDTDWEVHYNSNRLGIRLNGPRPQWTRSDGGEAGLHPSNIHDCEYAIGAINFTGDMPVILTHDGPSLGGFVCPVTIARAELWKVGQVKPGDRIRFRRMDFDQARTLETEIAETIQHLGPRPQPAPETPLHAASSCILAELDATGKVPKIVYRQAGDGYILIEYGPNVLDLRLRLRVYSLMEALHADPIPGVQELSPGVRSLQVRYNSRVIHQQALLERLLEVEQRLPGADAMRLPTRVIHLPLAFEDSATLDAVARYRQSVRDTAPWLPDNVEFIRRLNGLDSREQVRDIIFDASYMVLGLGDVYLGAPCAVPVDPRHRLLTSKYNPARTYTAEGTVGIGGVYMCIYGMDSPGGYQLVGRTLPIWNKFLKNNQFEADKPWLLRFFDQVRFYPVSEDELIPMREAFREGRLAIRIDEETFDLAAHERFLADNAMDIEVFRTRQKAAFDEEVARWQADAAMDTEVEPRQINGADSLAPETDGHVVCADINGSVWKMLVEPGQTVVAGDPLLVVEAMKMEFPVHAPVTGSISRVLCAQGLQIAAGDPLMVIE